MIVVLSSNKVLDWLKDAAFRSQFPELTHLYQQFDQEQAIRKAKGLCGGCGSTRGVYARMLLQLKNSLSLSRKLRDYLGAKEIRYVDRSAKTAEVKTLI